MIMSRKRKAQKAAKVGAAKPKRRKPKRSPKTAAVAVTVRRQPTVPEQKAISAAQLYQEKRARPVDVAFTDNKLDVPHSDKNGWLAQLREAFGTASNAFAIQQVSWLGAGVDAQGENSAQRLNSALAAGEYRGRNSDPKFLRCLQIDEEPELRRLFCW